MVVLKVDVMGAWWVEQRADCLVEWKDVRLVVWMVYDWGHSMAGLKVAQTVTKWVV